MRFAAEAACLLAMLAGGCATSPPDVRVDVPFLRQEEGHCGESALAMLLTYAGKPADPALLRRRLHLPVLNGTVTDLMVATAREQGASARRVNSSDSSSASSSMIAPMVALLGPFDEGGVGHYVVVTGYHAGRWVEMHSGRAPNRRIAWSKFMDRWAGSEYEGLVIDP